MAKSSKKSSEATPTPPAPVISEKDSPTVESPRVPAKTAAPKLAATTARKRTAASKTAAAPKPRKSPVAKKPLPAEVAISDDEIRLRAYFLAEQRLREGTAGDTSHDWHEARRQLLAEAAGRA
ncbi:MAG TPA: DUF2934 domain-containing protein [Chthoniobacterales bacterium]|nr:DUF2934 domain-containing protein [Chthoniobacterales bacterium]